MTLCEWFGEAVIPPAWACLASSFTVGLRCVKRNRVKPLAGPLDSFSRHAATGRRAG